MVLLHLSEIIHGIINCGLLTRFLWKQQRGTFYWVEKFNVSIENRASGGFHFGTHADRWKQNLNAKIHKNKVFWTNNLASSGSIWNCSFAQHPQLGNRSCVLYQPDNNIVCCSYTGVKRQLAVRDTCRREYSICILNGLLYGYSDQVTSVWVKARRRESWQGESLRSPCCLLGKSRSFDSKKLDLLLPSLWSPAVTA